MGTLLRQIDTDDTPVWMLWKNLTDQKYDPVLVAWYNIDQYSVGGFLTLKTFGTEGEALDWLSDFLDAMWRF